MQGKDLHLTWVRSTDRVATLRFFPVEYRAFLASTDKSPNHIMFFICPPPAFAGLVSIPPPALSPSFRSASINRPVWAGAIDRIRTCNISLTRRAHYRCDTMAQPIWRSARHCWPDDQHGVAAYCLLDTASLTTGIASPAYNLINIVNSVTCKVQ